MLNGVSVVSRVHDRYSIRAEYIYCLVDWMITVTEYLSVDR